MNHFNATMLYSRRGRDESGDSVWMTAAEEDLAAQQEVLSIPRSVTMPETSASSVDMYRTASGGLILRRRTYEEQKELSHAKASQLSSLYEMSGVQKHTALNKNASFHHKATEYTGKPSFAPMDAKQAAEAFRKRQAEASERRKEDPLRTERERKVDRLAAMRKTRSSKPLGNRQDECTNTWHHERIEVGDGIEVVAYNLPQMC